MVAAGDLDGRLKEPSTDFEGRRRAYTSSKACGARR
jgi:hypothetical protein